MRKLFIVLFILIWGYNFSTAQEKYLSDQCFSDQIKGVKLHRTEWNLSYPIITLNSDEKLILHFDLLGNNTETYYYTFIHCDKEWRQSDIFPSDYLDGFAENQIEDYNMSFNTTTNYIHYSLTLPNRNVSFRYSGNYIVKVYPIGEPDTPILTKRFMISENQVSINADPQRPKNVRDYSSGQQLDFTVDYPGMQLSDPYRTIYASVLQNGRWDNAKTLLKPNFIGNKQLVFNDLSGKLIFEAGNEFRYFDIKSLRYQTEFVRAVEHESGKYHVYLMHSDNRSGAQYFYHKDFNGKFFTAVQEGRDYEVEADYVYVYFTLPSDYPINGNVYIYGALSDWNMTDNNRMSYNQDSKSYECTMLLKQGWYNYIFAVADKQGKLLANQPFENNHFETENDYLVLIYLSEPMDRYDRLLGSKVCNTLK